jgi:hypothetical protein
MPYPCVYYVSCPALACTSVPYGKSLWAASLFREPEVVEPSLDDDAV